MKKVLLILSLILIISGLGQLAVNVYLEHKNPVGKCFKLKDDGGLKFVKSLTFKIFKQFDDKSLSSELVKFDQPEDLEQLMFVLQATAGKVNLKSEESLVKVDCPKEELK